MLLRVEPHGLFSWLFLNSSHLLPFLLSIPLFLPSLTGGASRSVRLSLIRSGLALQQPRCAIRGSGEGPVVSPPVLCHRHLPLSNAGPAGPTPHLMRRRPPVVPPDRLERGCGAPPRTLDQGPKDRGKALQDEAD